jgi:hypothetical protein
MITEICKFHNVSKAKITVACDNISALHQALDTSNIITSKNPDHDLLFAIREKMRNCNVQWSFTHVKGHQDDNKEAHELNRLEVLNIEMDQLAKQTLKNCTDNPPMFNVDGSPWSIWINGKKIVKDISVHIYITRSTDLAHWKSKVSSLTNMRRT